MGDAPPTSYRTAWFHCFSGVAGDMALGSLVDAGADLDEVRDIVRRLPVAGWDLEAEPVLRSGVAATKVHVRGADDDHPHRSWRTVRGLIDDAALPERVRRRAIEAFTLLAGAEAALHRLPVDDVHLHEVGAIDAIVDIVGTAAALEVLDVADVVCSPVTVGQGRVQAAHGHLPNPSPAVVRILTDVGAPVRGVDSPVELTTPTGAALMVSLATRFGPLPEMALVASGHGAGSADVDGAVNATQVVVGDTPTGSSVGVAGAGQPVVSVETTVDDASGEVLASAIGSLLDAGALDAWVVPTVGKKGRPGHLVTALVGHAEVAAVAEALRTSTGSLGVRAVTQERWPATRGFTTVPVGDHPVRVKVSPMRVKAEHDDVARVAAATGLSVLEVAARAEAAFWAIDQSPWGSQGQ